MIRAGAAEILEVFRSALELKRHPNHGASRLRWAELRSVNAQSREGRVRDVEANTPELAGPLRAEVRRNQHRQRVGFLTGQVGVQDRDGRCDSVAIEPECQNRRRHVSRAAPGQLRQHCSGVDKRV